MARQKKKRGCLTNIIYLLFALIILAMIAGANDKGNQNTGKATNQPTSTVAITETINETTTNKPILTPTIAPTDEPTSKPTETPGIADITAEEAAQRIAKEMESNSISFDFAMEIDGLVNIGAVIGTAWDEKDAVRLASKYALDVSERLFDNHGVDSLVLYFDTELRDAYGNTSQSRVINMTIRRETAEKINYEWMKKHIYSSTADFFAILDDYTVHNALSKGVY